MRLSKTDMERLMDTNMTETELGLVIDELCTKYGTEVVARAWMAQSKARPQV